MAAVLLLLTLGAADVAAHGGQYAAPAGPPVAPRPPQATRGQTASTSGAAGALTGGTAAGATTGWQVWWEHNKHALLLERQRNVTESAATAERDGLTGRGRRDLGGDGRRPDRARIDTNVLPALRALLERSDDPDILDSAVLALARAADEPQAADAVARVTALLKSRVASVQSSAALSLGVLASPRAVPHIKALLADGKEGHDLMGHRGVVPDLVRAFAALSLGLANDAASVPLLTELIDETPDRQRDLKACAIVALGLMDNEASEQASRTLLRLLEDRSLDPVLKAQVPTALARLASRPGAYDPAAWPAFMRAFTAPGTDAPVRQSLALALGRVADVTGASEDSDETVGALMHAASHDDDLSTRQFSLMALARIGARDRQAAAHAALHASLLKLLLVGVDDPSRPSFRAWFLLAAATYADGQPAARGTVLEHITEAYDKERDPDAKAAGALAFGILVDSGQGERLRADFERLTNEEFRGCAGLALGLLGETEATEMLRAACRNPALSVTARGRIAQGLLLLGDTGVSNLLVERLASSRSLPVCAGTAAALGLVGDVSALEPLEYLAVDPAAVSLTRAFACVALGMLCEKTDLPWNARLTEDCNYLALVPALAQVLDIL